MDFSHLSRKELEDKLSYLEGRKELWGKGESPYDKLILWVRAALSNYLEPSTEE